MTVNELRAEARVLEEFARNLLVRLGFPAADAQTGAAALVWANLRGLDSHGVLRLPWLVELVETGQLNPQPVFRVLKETAAILVLDADRALGAVSASHAMRRAMEKARTTGIGWALIRNTVTPLAMSYYTLLAAQEDMVGLALTCNAPNMAPYGAKAAGLHNSPISIAVPAAQHHRLVLDMATSVAAQGKIDLALDRGITIPEGWALDPDGNPTTDPTRASIMLPVGGPKGSGLATMFEALASIMAGNPLVAPVLLQLDADERHQQNSVLAALDIATFTDIATYKAHIDNLIDGLTALPTAEGVERIMVPGELEFTIEAERTQNGIPLAAGTVAKLHDIAREYQLEPLKGA